MILRVRAQSWQAAYAHVFPGDRLRSLTAQSDDWVGWWEGVLARPPPHAHVLVAERTGGVAGFSHLGVARDEQDESVGELYAIYVLPDAWGGGLGRALMDETLTRLRNEGFSEAILWVLEDNPRARRFDERAGWHADGGSKEDEWLGTVVREVRYRIDLR